MAKKKRKKSLTGWENAVSEGGVRLQGVQENRLRGGAGGKS